MHWKHHPGKPALVAGGQALPCSLRRETGQQARADFCPQSQHLSQPCSVSRSERSLNKGTGRTSPLEWVELLRLFYNDKGGKLLIQFISFIMKSTRSPSIFSQSQEVRNRKALRGLYSCDSSCFKAWNSFFRRKLPHMPNKEKMLRLIWWGPRALPTS